MQVMVVGGGGREHALAWGLANSPSVKQVFIVPGNPGTAEVGTNLSIPLGDLDGIVAAAVEREIDLVMIGPEAPLADGLADRLRDAGIPTCGPSRAASRIESSKTWAKEIMAAAKVPTATFTVARTVDEGIAALDGFGLPVVLKADGLAAGKGVVVAATRDEAERTIRSFIEEGALGSAGATVLIEECLSGQEVSLMALTDGTTVVPLVPACDYKRALDGDQGPNTGGMGAYAPVPAVDDAMLAEIVRTVLEPTVRAMAEAGTPMNGVLYAGLMLTAAGPMVLEFNARFGDPETQVIVPMLDGDLGALLLAAATGTLADAELPAVRAGAAVAVVLASGGYPGGYETDREITGLGDVPSDVLVFHAGTATGDRGQLVTAGGRVLAVVGRGGTIAEARARASAGVAAIEFEGMQSRGDIALREV